MDEPMKTRKQLKASQARSGMTMQAPLLPSHLSTTDIMVKATIVLLNMLVKAMSQSLQQ